MSTMRRTSMIAPLMMMMMIGIPFAKADGEADTDDDEEDKEEHSAKGSINNPPWHIHLNA